MITIKQQKFIVKQVSEGFTSAEIAHSLKVSKKTVEKHIEIIKAIHGAKNLYNLVAIFFRKKLLK